jgi:multidrug efflux pump subunit AcrB
MVRTILLANPLALLLAAACAGPPPAEPRPESITIEAQWKARTAAELAEKVAKPIEAELAGLRSMSRIVTRCDRERCVIVLRFNAGANGYELAFEANAAIKRARPKLPEGARVAVYAVDPFQPPDIELALIFGPRAERDKIFVEAQQYATRLLRLPNVQRYALPGQPRRDLHVEVHPARAKQYGLDPEAVARLIAEHVVVVDGHRRIIVDGSPSPRRVRDLSQIIVKREKKRVIRLRDVARIEPLPSQSTVCRVDGSPAIRVRLYLRSGATTAERRVCLRRVLEVPCPAAARRVVVLSVTP